MKLKVPVGKTIFLANNSEQIILSKNEQNIIILYKLFLHERGKKNGSPQKIYVGDGGGLVVFI
jgi:hypothetical protein